jgi:hypothetical protein
MIEFTLWGVLVKIWPGEILGIAMIAGGVWLFTRAQLDKRNPIDLSEMFVWPGTRHTSMAMFLAFVAGFSATWVVIDQEFRKTLSTELFLGYLAVMIGGKGLTEGINAWRNKPPGPPPPAIPPAQQQFVGTAGAVNALPPTPPDAPPPAPVAAVVETAPDRPPAAVKPRKRAKAKRRVKR